MGPGARVFGEHTRRDTQDPVCPDRVSAEPCGQFAQQVSKASLSVSAAAGGPWVLE